MDIVITIVIVIVLLGILVGAHEAGHLIVAKAFNVYCLEYSIGFGPKLFSRKRKGGETYFSLRAIPFGGYVSMYGEGMELDDGTEVPPERSIQGISRPRQAFVMAAGITVNFLLCIFFAFIYVTCFPVQYAYGSFSTGVNLNGNVAEVGEATYSAYYLFADGTVDGYEPADIDRLYAPTGYNHTETIDGNEISVAYFVIDDNATIDGETYVAMYRVLGVDNDNDFASNLFFFEPDADYWATAGQMEIGLSNIPEGLSDPYVFNGGEEVNFELTFVSSTESGIDFQERISKKISGICGDNGLELSNVDFHTYMLKRYRNFSQAMSAFCELFVSLFEMIGAGLASLFTLNLESLGSVVMMGSQINLLSRTIGIGETFFYYGAALSLNLALFNLIPIPGLDGWQLLVNAIEGISKKKIPDKVKNIVSWIGLALIFVLFILLIVKDILTVSGLI